MNHGRSTGMTAVRRGRPRRVESETASVRIWAWVTPTERAAIDAFASEAGIEVGVIVRDAVNEYVADCSEQKIFTGTHKSSASVS